MLAARIFKKVVINISTSTPTFAPGSSSSSLSSPSSQGQAPAVTCPSWLCYSALDSPAASLAAVRPRRYSQRPHPRATQWRGRTPAITHNSLSIPSYAHQLASLGLDTVQPHRDKRSIIPDASTCLDTKTSRKALKARFKRPKERLRSEWHHIPALNSASPPRACPSSASAAARIRQQDRARLAESPASAS